MLRVEENIFLNVHVRKKNKPSNPLLPNVPQRVRLAKILI